MSAIAYFTGWITINNQGLMEPSSHWPLLTLMQSPTNFEVDGKQPTLQTCKATSKLVIRQNGVPQHLWYAAPSINHPYCWTLTIPCGKEATHKLRVLCIWSKSEFSNEQWPQQSNWHLLGCKLNSDAVTVWIKQVGTFGVQCSLLVDKAFSVAWNVSLLDFCCSHGSFSWFTWMTCS